VNGDGSLSYGRWDLRHDGYLATRAVHPDVANERHYCSIDGATDPMWAELPSTFGKAKQHPGLVIPTFGPDGRVNGVQVRYDTPRPDAEGKLQRYANPGRIPAKRLDVHPRSRRFLDDILYPLYVTEGIAKADSLVSHGAVTVGLTGVGTWECDDWAVEGGGDDVCAVGHPLVDDFLEFARWRARPNMVRAYTHDLKTFFAVVGKENAEVRAADVMAFVKDQVGSDNRSGRRSSGGCSSRRRG
jgi:hypothetical protein